MSGNVGWGRLRAPSRALALLAALTALLVTASGAMASHVGTAPEGVSYDAGSRTVTYHARNGEFNTITVTETATDYVFTETGTLQDGITPIPAVTDNEPGSVCTVSGGVTTCTKTAVDSIVIFGMDETGLESVPHDTITVDARLPQGTTLDGGGGNDNIFGSPARDVIRGGDGLDLIDARNGNDIIDTGNAIEDPFFERFEQADGGSDFDTITYANRPSAITTDFAITGFAIDSDGFADVLSGGIEKVVGSNFDDEMIGGIQSDTFVGNGGNDVMCGGLGIDTVDYSDVEFYDPGGTQGVHVTLDGPLPTDVRHTLPFTNSTNILEYRKARRDCRDIVQTTGIPRPPPAPRDCTPNDGIPGVEQDCVGDDVENIIGSPRDDVLTGNDPDQYEGQGPRIEPHGVNDIDGGDGNDLIDGGFGPDALSGGNGADTVTYAGRADGVFAAIDGAPNDGTDTSSPDPNDRGFLLGDFDPRSKTSDSIEGDVENVVGTAHDDLIRGDGDGNLLQGGDGNDFIDGGGGPDQIEAGAGDDAAVGGGGNDLILGGDGIDQLDGENDNDDVRAEAGGELTPTCDCAEFVTGGAGADGLSGGAGYDVLDYSDATQSVTVTLDGRNDDGPAEGDNALPDFEAVVGGIAADNLTGSDNAEVLVGGDGDDDLTGAGGADTLIGGAGADLAAYAERSAGVVVDLAAGAADDGDALEEIEEVLGGNGDDTLRGDGLDNVLMGGPGNDRVSGAEGNDILIGSAGNDVVAGDVGNDTLYGSDGDDELSGGAGADDLKGEAGEDSLDGGPGTDRHTGGPGIDMTVYASRSAGVSVNLDGKDGNGERNENDFINHGTESLTTGSGADTIDADDNLAGRIKCGGGADVVTVDPDDRVDGDCESIRVSALGTRCTASTARTRMLKSGVIPVRVFCAVAAKGTVQLQSVQPLKASKKSKRKILKLGRKSFNLKAGQRATVRVKASNSARRVVRRKARLSVRARISAKTQTAKAATIRSSAVLTVRASR